MSSSPLLDVALNYLKIAGLPPSDSEPYTTISGYFSDLIANHLSLDKREGLIRLLSESIHTITPLEKIEAILSCDDAPLVSSSQDFQFDALTSLRKKTRPWSPIEDTRLLAGIHRYGLENWQFVAQFVGNSRTRAQCAQRWSRGLDPRISKDQWSSEDEAKLIYLIETSQNRNWTIIASQIGNRSDVQCRYHFLQLQRDPNFREQHPNLIRDLPQSLKIRSPQHTIPPLPIQKVPLTSERRNEHYSKSQGRMPLPPIPPNNFQCPKLPLPVRVPINRERHLSFSAHEIKDPIFQDHELDDFDDEINNSHFASDSSLPDPTFEWESDLFSTNTHQMISQRDFETPVLW